MKNKVFLILKKELREVFRDRKSLAMMLLTPLLIPLLILGVSFLFEVQIDNNDNNFNKIGFNYQLSEEEKMLANYLNIDFYTGNLDKIKKLYNEQKINLYIIKKENNYEINYDENNEVSSSTYYLADKYLQEYKKILQTKYLNNLKMDSSKVLNIITVSNHSISKKEDNFYVNFITTYSFLFIIMAITISATYPATDATAGEKERGTLETLLTFPIKSRDIIVGKFLSVSCSSIITGLVGFGLTLISLIIANKNFELYKNINLIPNMVTILITILIIITYSILISGLCIAVASKSKTFKEAQSALTPLSLACFFPGMVAFMLKIKTNLLISLIPFVNYVQIFSDVNSGKVNILYILMMFLSTLIFISIVLSYIIKAYKSEKVLFRK